MNKLGLSCAESASDGCTKHRARKRQPSHETHMGTNGRGTHGCPEGHGGRCKPHPTPCVAPSQGEKGERSSRKIAAEGIFSRLCVSASKCRGGGTSLPSRAAAGADPTRHRVSSRGEQGRSAGYTIRFRGPPWTLHVALPRSQAIRFTREGRALARTRPKSACF